MNDKEEACRVVLEILEDLIAKSSNPFFQKFGNYSIMMYLSSDEGLYNPLTTCFAEKEEGKMWMNILVKNNTSNISVNKPYRRGEYDFQRKVEYTSFGLRDKVLTILKEAYPFLSW